MMVIMAVQSLSVQLRHHAWAYTMTKTSLPATHLQRLESHTSRQPVMATLHRSHHCDNSLHWPWLSSWHEREHCSLSSKSTWKGPRSVNDPVDQIPSAACFITSPGSFLTVCLHECLDAFTPAGCRLRLGILRGGADRPLLDLEGEEGRRRSHGMLQPPQRLVRAMAGSKWDHRSGADRLIL